VRPLTFCPLVVLYHRSSPVTMSRGPPRSWPPALEQAGGLVEIRPCTQAFAQRHHGEGGHAHALAAERVERAHRATVSLVAQKTNSPGQRPEVAVAAFTQAAHSIGSGRPGGGLAFAIAAGSRLPASPAWSTRWPNAS
jgi:hypothetical protein